MPKCLSSDHFRYLAHTSALRLLLEHGMTGISHTLARTAPCTPSPTSPNSP